MFSWTYVWYVIWCAQSSYSACVRQLAVAQQPRHLEEARLLGELLDRDSRGSGGSPCRRR